MRRIVLDRLAVARDTLSARRAILVVDGPASSDVRVVADSMGILLIAGAELARLRSTYPRRYDGVPDAPARDIYSFK